MTDKKFGKIRVSETGKIFYRGLSFDNHDHALEVAYDLEKQKFYLTARHIRDAVKYAKNLAKGPTRRYSWPGKHGWYSVNMRKVSGSCLYVSPEGKEVEITCVTNNPNDSGTGWKDIVYVGPVKSFVRRK
jgi:hypothetical protein